MLETEGSAKKIAMAALVIELHDDGTYTIIKNRLSTSDKYINQTVLINEEGLIRQRRKPIVTTSPSFH